MKRRIAILGGGVSGLSAAYELQKAVNGGANLAFNLFEGRDRLGGNIATYSADGCTVEAGAEAFLTAKPWATTLARELGLENELLGSNDSRRRTYILRGSRLIAIPDGMQLFVPSNPLAAALSPLFCLGSKMGFVREALSPPASLPPDSDESVEDFVTRHFGREVNDTLAAPLLAGIYGGSTAGLSARAVLPRLVELETTHKSLVRAALADRKRPSQPVFTTFRAGMAQLTDALVRRLAPAAINVRTAVIALRHEPEGWRLVLSDGRQEMFTQVIIATPAYISGGLLNHVSPQLGKMLSAIPYSSSITVACAFQRASLTKPLPTGFGFLVPASEQTSGRHRIMACTFTDQKFEGRAPADTVLLRAFIGCGTKQPPSSDDAEVSSAVLADLQSILGIVATSRWVRVHRWPRSIPQYEVGHMNRVARMEELTGSLPGIHLAGNALHGVGIPDAVRSGQIAAARALDAQRAAGSISG